MKHFNLTLLSLLIGMSFSLQSCFEDTCQRELTYIKSTPVYLTAEEIHSIEIGNEDAKELCQPGKIYYYNDYLFINEGREGVHVIDNSVPSNPVNLTFISIPGSEDIAIKNGRLLANSYTDLLTIDIDDIHNAKLVSRTEDVFPPILSTSDGQLLVYYKNEEVTEVVDCDQVNGFRADALGSFIDVTSGFDNFAGSESAGQSAQTGIAGSMARFSLIGNYLYVVDNNDLHVFSLDGDAAILVNTVDIGWGIETIFPYGDKLFIGSNSGMFIFDNSNPTAPVMLSAFAHARACDPVFVKDNYAYVTLRSGNACQGFVNQLDLIDITDLTNPVLLKTFPMHNPQGLSIKGNHLFLCEGEQGLKSFDITNPLQLGDNLLDQVKGFDAFDVIALPGAETNLLVIGKDGFYQFNADKPSDLMQISFLGKNNCE